MSNFSLNPLNTYTMLGNTTYGVANGPYNGTATDFLSYPVEGASYYAGRGHIQTIFIDVTGFVGNIELKGSLDTLAQDAKYAHLDAFVSSGGNTTPSTGVFPITVEGNFVWLQSNITDYTAGNINSITISY